MILIKDDVELPEWVKKSVPMTCKYCESPLASNRNENGVFTYMWCTNPKCPGHMAYKADYISKYYDIKGFGPAKALDWIHNYKPQSHLELIPIWFNGDKPKETLSRISDLCCIKDFGYTQAQKFLDKYSSFEEMFEKEPYIPDALMANKEFLIDSQKFFTIPKPMASENLYVMATGSIHGFSNRSEFFTGLNEMYGDIVHIIETGARKTGVACLIKEEDAVDHKKSRYAMESGIPIMTPKEFVRKLNYEVEYRRKKLEKGESLENIGIYR